MVRWRNPGGAGVAALRNDIIAGRSTQTFGNTGFEQFHNGIDIVLPDANLWHGAPPVHSPLSGTVVSVTDEGSRNYGKSVVVQDSNGFQARVGHLADFYAISDPNGVDYGRRIQEGDEVHAGNVLGHEGSTGRSTGTHVHYTIYDPAHRAVDLTLGRPAVAHADNLAQDNTWYSIYHDLGLGAGDSPGQEWHDGPPAPGQRIAAVTYPPLSGNPGPAYGDPNPHGDPTPGGGGNPVVDPAGQPTPGQCSQGYGVQVQPGESCPPGYTPGGPTSVPANMCFCTLQPNTQCATILGVQVCTPTMDSINQYIAVIGLVIVGAIILGAGVFSLAKDSPAAVVVQPVVSGVKSTVKAGAKVAALA